MEDLVSEKIVEIISSRTELGELRQKCDAYRVSLMAQRVTKAEIFEACLTLVISQKCDTTRLRQVSHRKKMRYLKWEELI